MDLTTIAGGAAALLVRPEAVAASGEAGERLTPRLRELAAEFGVGADRPQEEDGPAVIRSLASVLRAQGERDASFGRELSHLVYDQAGIRPGGGRLPEAAGESAGRSGSAERDRLATYAAAQALHELGGACWRRGHLDLAASCYRESGALLGSVGDKAGVARCRNDLGAAYEDQGRVREATAAYEQSSAAFSDLGDRRGGATALVNVGRLYHAGGRSEEAVNCLRRAAAAFRDLGDVRGAGGALMNLANVLQDLGRHDDAAAALDDCKRAFDDADDPLGVGRALHNLGAVAEEKGRWDVAERCYAQSARLLRERGERADAGRALRAAGRVRQVQGQWSAALDGYRDSAALYRDVGDRHESAEALYRSALLCVQLGEFDRAAGYLAEALPALEDPDGPVRAVPPLSLVPPADPAEDAVDAATERLAPAGPPSQSARLEAWRRRLESA